MAHSPGGKYRFYHVRVQRIMQSDQHTYLIEADDELSAESIAWDLSEGLNPPDALSTIRSDELLIVSVEEAPEVPHTQIECLGECSCRFCNDPEDDLCVDTCDSCGFCVCTQCGGFHPYNCAYFTGENPSPFGIKEGRG